MPVTGSCRIAGTMQTRRSPPGSMHFSYDRSGSCPFDPVPLLRREEMGPTEAPARQTVPGDFKTSPRRTPAAVADEVLGAEPPAVGRNHPLERFAQRLVPPGTASLTVDARCGSRRKVWVAPLTWYGRLFNAPPKQDALRARASLSTLSQFQGEALVEQLH
jgi:hypothetical protein